MNRSKVRSTDQNLYQETKSYIKWLKWRDQKIKIKEDKPNRWQDEKFDQKIKILWRVHKVKIKIKRLKARSTDQMRYQQFAN